MPYDPKAEVAEYFVARKRHRSAAWLLGLGLLLGLINGIYAVVNPQDNLPKVEQLLPFTFPVLIGFMLSPFAKRMFADVSNDEFERAALSRATRHSYVVLTGLIMALCLWLWLGGVYGLQAAPNSQTWFVLSGVFFCISCSLPVLIAELIIPMPPKGDSEE